MKKRRAGPEVKSDPARFPFRSIDTPPIALASTASPSQVISQRRGVQADSGSAIAVATNAVIPIAKPPHPGMDVKEPARSIVSRM